MFCTRYSSVDCCRITTASEANTPMSDNYDSIMDDNCNNGSGEKSSKLRQQVNGINPSSVIGTGDISYLLFV